jgi:hypothetical protein
MIGAAPPFPSPPPLRDKDIRRKNFFAIFGVNINYKSAVNWQVQLGNIGIDDFPLGKNTPNCPKYEWKVAVCCHRDDEEWKKEQAKKGIERHSISNVLQMHEVKEIPKVLGITASASVHLFHEKEKPSRPTQVMVLPVDDIFERLHEIHSLAGHAGIQSVKNAVDHALVDIPEHIVAAFRKTCHVCQEANSPAKKKRTCECHGCSAPVLQYARQGDFEVQLQMQSWMQRQLQL